jgi:hypothetical protein
LMQRQAAGLSRAWAGLKCLPSSASGTLSPASHFRGRSGSHYTRLKLRPQRARMRLGTLQRHMHAHSAP